MGLAAFAAHQYAFHPVSFDSFIANKSTIHSLDEAFKASAYAWETLADPKTVLSGDPRASPFARAFGTKETLWEFYDRPEQRYRQHRFGIGMQGVQALQPADAILTGQFLSFLKNTLGRHSIEK